MSRTMNTPLQRRRAARRAERTRSTYLVEALLLLACLLVVLAVVMALFGFAAAQGTQTAHAQQAMTLAQNAAERFAADPANVPPEQTADGFTVRCDVTEEPQAAGTMLHATITVERDGETAFQLQTARYASARAAASAGATEGGDAL